MSELSSESYLEALRWLKQANEELKVSIHLAQTDGMPPRTACFHAHLAAELGLKSCFIFFEIPFKKMHDLIALNSIISERLSYQVALTDLEQLNPWVIEGRYPGDIPDVDTATAKKCVNSAERILSTIKKQISG
jgi:HEPN domain-containing protein